MSAPLYLCLHVRDFPVQAEVRVHPELRGHVVAVLDGDPPLETVFSLNDPARRLGLEFGMSRLQAESFDNISLRSRVKQQEEVAFRVLMQCAERFSPRIEVLASPTETGSAATLVLDIAACERLFGTPKQIAVALRQETNAAGFDRNTAFQSSSHSAHCSTVVANPATTVPPFDDSSSALRSKTAVYPVSATTRFAS